MEEEAGYYENPLGDISVKIRDLEEKQRIIKEKTIILGKNLIEIRQKINEEMLEIKKEIGIIKQDVKKTNAFLEMVSKEFSNFARKEDVAILAKQAKMFQPLEFVKKSELNSLIKR